MLEVAKWVAGKLIRRVMAFFKTMRDQLKVNALVSHLEFAKARWSPNLVSATMHLEGAHKAMEKVKQARAEYILSRSGWVYVIELCEALGKLSREACREELVRICLSVYRWALENEDRIGEGGFLSEARAAVANDPGKIFSWYAEAAASGDAEAQSELGRMYAEGRGVIGDDVEAFRWTERAALQGDSQAQYNLGILYERGRGVPKDEREASRWYEKAAAQGYAAAQFNLGVLFDEGRGVPKGERDAVRWYEKAAANGNASAQLNLGSMHLKGRGVPKNEAEAFRWYERAAAQGDAIAQFNLGILHAGGHGVPRDEGKAVLCYGQAAAQGDTDAQFNLGVMYDEGRGVPKDEILAFAWISLAAASKAPHAIKEREKMERRLTLEQRDDAQKLSAELLDRIQKEKK